MRACGHGRFKTRLETYGGNKTDAGELQTLIFSVGKDHAFEICATGLGSL